MRLTQEKINQGVRENDSPRLIMEESLPLCESHSDHLLELTLRGRTTLAADHLLFPEINGLLTKTVGEFIRKIHPLFVTSRIVWEGSGKSFFRNLSLRQYAYETLLEMALNFLGLESRWLDQVEKSESLRFIQNTLEEWEDLEKREGDFSIAQAVVQKWLLKMKQVQKGNSMVAKTAMRIEENLDFKKPLFSRLLELAEKEVKTNIYYQMAERNICRFGNDYALGLRWLRHLGYEQVSTNPVLAARAYQDDPGLVQTFRREVRRHPRYKQWRANPGRHGEEIALFATLVALWENLYIFRPIFFNLQDSSGGGVVSFQLNPNIAHLVEESLRDVFDAYSLISKNLSLYDRYLLAGYRRIEERGRPNLVIKVAATTPAARTITRVLNSFGIGTNITVDFSVSQEATLIVEEMEGMAEAIRKGIRPTQLYMTNMGGRLESHLREKKLEEFFQQLRVKIGEAEATEKIYLLSEANGTKEKVLKAKSFEEKVTQATRYAHGQRTIDAHLYEPLKEVASQETLVAWEEAIGKSGILVARRIWEIFFSPGNRKKWVQYLARRKGIAEDQASLIMDRIHYLPASKRKPLDTFWALSSKNVVHTEFPDHQENVRRMAASPHFLLKEYEESISKPFPEEVTTLLYGLEDFKKAYEINPELEALFREAGIIGDYGPGGLMPLEWSSFGPVQKTLEEFKTAYDNFQREMVSILKKTGRK